MLDHTRWLTLDPPLDCSLDLDLLENAHGTRSTATPELEIDRSQQAHLQRSGVAASQRRPHRGARRWLTRRAAARGCSSHSPTLITLKGSSSGRFIHRTARVLLDLVSTARRSRRSLTSTQSNFRFRTTLESTLFSLARRRTRASGDRLIGALRRCGLATFRFRLCKALATARST
jgi:hypothetical protein